MGKPNDCGQNQEMVKLILCLAVTLLVRPVLARDLCDQFMNSAVGLEENSSVWLDGGQLTRSSKSNEMLSFEDGKKARVKLAHFVGKTEELSASAVMQAMVFCSSKDWAGFNMDLQMKIAETSQPSSSKAKGVR